MLSSSLGQFHIQKSLTTNQSPVSLLGVEKDLRGVKSCLSAGPFGEDRSDVGPTGDSRWCGPALACWTFTACLDDTPVLMSQTLWATCEADGLGKKTIKQLLVLNQASRMMTLLKGKSKGISTLNTVVQCCNKFYSFPFWQYNRVTCWNIKEFSFKSIYFFFFFFKKHSAITQYIHRCNTDAWER